MKKNKFLIVLGVFLLAGKGAQAGEEKKVKLTGWVSDAACGAKHMEPGGADCIRKCMRGGASVGHPEWTPQEMVFVTDGKKKIWTVENPEALTGHEGEHLRIMAFVHASQSLLFVRKVFPASTGQKIHR